MRRVRKALLGFAYELPLNAARAAGLIAGIITHHPILLLPRGDNYTKQFILQRGALLAPLDLGGSMSPLSLPIL